MGKENLNKKSSYISENPEQNFIAKVQNVITGKISYILPGTPEAAEMLENMMEQPGDFD